MLLLTSLARAVPVVNPTWDPATLTAALDGPGVTVLGVNVLPERIYGSPNDGPGVGTLVDGPFDLGGIVLSTGAASDVSDPFGGGDGVGQTFTGFTSSRCGDVATESYGFDDVTLLKIQFTVDAGYEGVILDWSFATDEAEGEGWVGQWFDDVFAGFLGTNNGAGYGGPGAIVTVEALTQTPVHAEGRFWDLAVATDETGFAWSLPRTSHRVPLAAGPVHGLTLVVCDADDATVDSAGFIGPLRGCPVGCVDEVSMCGDAVVELDEACDDGNAASYDGCSSACAVEVDTDGDGLVDNLEDDLGTDPLQVDTDADGWDDRREVRLGTDPLLADGDGDGADDPVDPCPLDPADDSDADGSCDGSDLCPGLDDATWGAWPADADGDGFGDADETVDGCPGEAGLSVDSTDCHDLDPAIHPAAQEVCNRLDDDCDGRADDRDPSVDPATLAWWYQDADHDGAGDAAVAVAACDNPTWYVAGPTDCDDTDPTLAGPVAWRFDGDGDGFGGGAVAGPDTCVAPGVGWVGGGPPDCDDAAAAAYPGAVDACADGIDQNCDGVDATCHAPLSAAFDLMIDAEILREGVAVESRVGLYPSIAPDLDGDGLDDLVYGSRSGVGGMSESGFVAIESNPAAGTDTPVPGIYGEPAQLVVRSAGLGDIDGDGYGDLAVSGESQAITWVFSGPVTGAASTSAATATLLPLFEDQYPSAPTLLGPGDVDGDGLADLFAGNLPGDMDGIAYLFEGPLEGTSDVSTASAAFAGASIDAYFGEVAAAGDLDGDGLPDLVLGTHVRAEVGGGFCAVAFLAPFEGLATADDGIAWWTPGPGAGDGVGRAVAIPGDLDGDGRTEVVLSDYTALNLLGQVYVLAADSLGDTPLTAAWLTIDGESMAGGALVGPGDVDRDGLDDLVIGPYVSEQDSGVGGPSYLFPGGVSGSASLATTGVRFDSPANVSHLGGGGDLDGDGYPELVFGATWYDLPATDAGILWVVHGGPF